MPKTTAYVSPIAPLIMKFADMLKHSGFAQDAEKVLIPLRAGEPIVALDEAMCYIEQDGVEVPLEMLESAMRWLDDDGYGILACRRLIQQTKQHQAE